MLQWLPVLEGDEDDEGWLGLAMAFERHWGNDGAQRYVGDQWRQFDPFINAEPLPVRQTLCAGQMDEEDDDVFVESLGPELWALDILPQLFPRQTNLRFVLLHDDGFYPHGGVCAGLLSGEKTLLCRFFLYSISCFLGRDKSIAMPMGTPNAPWHEEDGHMGYILWLFAVGEIVYVGVVGDGSESLTTYFRMDRAEYVAAWLELAPGEEVFPETKKRAKWQGRHGHVAGVVLAAGFGTRMKRTMESDIDFRHLSNVPKPLLPLGKNTTRTLAGQWAADLLRCGGPVVVATNAAHESLYRQALTTLPVGIIANDATDNASRRGAVADLAAAVAHLGPAKVYVVVAGDTLLEDHVRAQLPAMVERFQASNDACHTLGYPMADPAVECRSRGLLVLGPDDRVVRFDEKPAVPPPEPCLASAPLYLMDERCIQEMGRFLASAYERNAPVDSFDAPGFLVKHLVEVGLPVRGIQIRQAMDIGTLEDYKTVLQSDRFLV